MEAGKSKEDRRKPEGDPNAPTQKAITSLESLRELYLSERGRRESIRSQIAIPVSIVSFSIFGYVAFAQYFNVAKLNAVTVAMDILMILSLMALFAALVYLGRVERTFMKVRMETLEDVRDSESEYQYFQNAYLSSRAENEHASKLRARAFTLLLVALGCFVLAVSLLPFHLRDSGVHGRGGSDALIQMKVSPDQ